MDSTIGVRTTKVRAWLRWCWDQEKNPWEADDRDVQRFIDGRRVGPRTRYCWISHLHCFYEWAMRERYTEEDPTERVIRPRLRPTLPRPVGDSDLAEALEYANPRHGLWLALMAFGGLRCGEVAGLERDAILDSEQLLRVLGKGAKERMVPIHEEVWAALRRFGPLPSSGPIFRTESGRPYKAEEVSRELCLFFDDIGIPDVKPHQLRHWSITLVTRSKGIRVAQEFAGHASVATTAIYSKVAGVDVADAVAAIQRPVRGSPLPAA
ncbi:MAG: tyrosine-type recombinase/integrase [Solirubrobacteraceae bacterium]